MWTEDQNGRKMLVLKKSKANVDVWTGTKFSESVRKREREVSCSFLVPPILPAACPPAIKGSSGCWNAKNAAVAKTINASELMTDVRAVSLGARPSRDFSLIYTHSERRRLKSSEAAVQGKISGVYKKICNYSRSIDLGEKTTVTRLYFFNTDF